MKISGLWETARGAGIGKGGGRVKNNIRVNDVNGSGVWGFGSAVNVVGFVFGFDYRFMIKVNGIAAWQP